MQTPEEKLQRQKRRNQKFKAHQKKRFQKRPKKNYFKDEIEPFCITLEEYETIVLPELEEIS